MTRKHTKGYRAARASVATATTRRRDKPPPIPDAAARLAAVQAAVQRRKDATAAAHRAGDIGVGHVQVIRRVVPERVSTRPDAADGASSGIPMRR